MSEEYKAQIKAMGKDIEAIAKTVVALEDRLHNLELRNKKVEQECNKMIVMFYEERAADNQDQPAWQD